MEEGGAASRYPSDITLRTYCGRKPCQAFHASADQGSKTAGSKQGVGAEARSASGRGAVRHQPAPARGSSLSQFLARLSPAKASGRRKSGQQHAVHEVVGLAAPSQQLLGHKPTAVGGATAQQRNPRTDDGGSGIPAFRPSSPHKQACGLRPTSLEDVGGSPGKVQLQAVRVLRAQPAPAPSQQTQAQFHGQAQPPQGTPGYSEASSVARHINTQIANSIADLFAATPVAPHGHPGRGSGAPNTGTSSQHDAAFDRHGVAGSSTEGSPNGQSVTDCSEGWQTPGGGEPAGSLGAGTPGGGRLPVPPPPPAMLRTAMTESSALELQSILSPVFMSCKQRPLACEMDDPGRTTMFPRVRRRTSRLQRFVASVFGCFVPPPDRRSPAPSMRTPSSRRPGSSQGCSPLRPKLAFKVEPLRASLAGLSLDEPSFRASQAPFGAAAADFEHSGGCNHMRGTSASGSTAAAAAAVVYADLLGLQQGTDEEEGLHMNMASPVLPTRPSSTAATPAGHALAAAVAPVSNVLAKRNLMDALQSRGATAVLQQQPGQQQAGAVQQAGADQQPAKRQPAGQRQQQEQRSLVQHHLQPWQRKAARAGGAGAVALAKRAARLGRGAKASHVSLAQLLSVPLDPDQPQPEAGNHGSQHEDASITRQTSSGAKRGREALGASRATSSDDMPTFTPKRRDLSKPSYRSEALHLLLSPASAARHDGNQATAKREQDSRALWGPRAARAQAQLQLSVSAPASPSPAAGGVAATAAAGRGSRGLAAGTSAPSSPLMNRPRLNHAAAVRAAASQRKLQEQQVQGSAYLAKSPDRWLRAAAAEGLSLREAAVLASPGKSARRHHHPSPAARRQLPGWRQQQQETGAARVCAASIRAGTPAYNRFDSFEAGVEPYSARLLTTEKQKACVAQLPAPRQAAAPALRALEGGTLDFAQLAADRDAYLQMLQMLAEGLHVERTQLDAHKQPRQAPLPAHLLAGAAAQSRQERLHRSADGADTVRPRVEAAASFERPGSGGFHQSTVVYNLHGATCTDRLAGGHSVPLTPHHNALFGRDATPTKSSPIAQQRMLTISAAAVAQGAEQHGREPGAAIIASGSRQVSSAGAASSPAHSISFGSGGCRDTSECQGQDCGSIAAPNQQQAQLAGRKPAKRIGGVKGGNARLERLADLLETQQKAGRNCGLRELQAAGFTTHDLQALKQWLARQHR